MSRLARDPYPGTRPFRSNEHDLFFGRSTEAGEIAGLWLSNRLTVLVGPAGWGKTSLLNAGVLPFVSAGRVDVFPPGRVSYGATFPFAALPEHNRYTLALLRSWSPLETVTNLIGLTVRDFVHAHAERHGEAVLAVIDQVEELLADTGSRWAQRRAFLAEVADAVRNEPRLHLMVVARDDAVAMITEGLDGGVIHDVTPLTVSGAAEAAARPAALMGRSFASDAALSLAASLAVRGDGFPVATGSRDDAVVQPALLQVVCAGLWNSLPPHVTRITSREVRLYGSPDRALAAHCGAVVSAVADDHDLPADRLRAWLLETFITEHDTLDTAYEGATTTAGMPNSVARALVGWHLLRTELRAGARWYELLSERLIEPLRQARDVVVARPEPAAYLTAAAQAFALHDLAAAERYADAALQTSNDTNVRLRAELESLRGNIECTRENPAQAARHYRKAAELFEILRDTTAVAIELAAAGRMLLAQDMTEEAVDELLQAVERMPNDPVLQSDLAEALWYKGDSQSAVAFFTRALHADGGNLRVLRARGEVLADLGDARDALRDLDRVTLHDHPATRAARGLTLAVLGDHTGAKNEIREAVTEAPRNGIVLLRAAQAWRFSGDGPYAEELARRAVDATDPALSHYHREVALRIAARKEKNMSPG
jgi:tetratricopeptide (TPR) repeat protein